MNTEELLVFLRIETKMFSNLFKFPLSEGEKERKKKTNILSQPINFSKVQFTFKITNKQQQQQTKTPTITPKANVWRDKRQGVMTYVLMLHLTKADLVS